MVMMYYILSFLSVSSLVRSMPSGSSARSILPSGPGIVAFFSLLFLFYAHSFLIRSRYREFGLYHILGMDKGNVWRVMVWDGIFVALLALGIGQVFGIVFSELSELALLRLLREEVAYGVQISLSAVGHTLLIYGGIRLTFAFPLLWKMMQLFNLFDLPLAIAVTLVFFVVFVLFYAVVYKITSNSYYAIVNEEKV